MQAQGDFMLLAGSAPARLECARKNVESKEMEYVEAHGARIPIVGFGSMRLKDDAGREAILSAIRAGYRHIDTAAFYGNEKEVGDAIKASGVPREDIFLTTKVRDNNLKADDFARSLDNSLKLLDLPAVDLLLIHWPNPQVPMAESIGALNKAKRDGLTRHIGVCTHTVALLEEAWAVTKEPLVTNQIEVHPFLDQTKVIEATRRHGMSVTAYCPIARGRVPDNPVLERIGAAHGKTASQVSLRWLTQQGIIVIPGSGKPERQKENLAVLDFSLSPAEMNEIATLKRPDGRVVNPPQAPKWDV
jgi:2,5-diketo-D-gluconate reductase B